MVSCHSLALKGGLSGCEGTEPCHRFPGSPPVCVSGFLNLYLLPLSEQSIPGCLSVVLSSYASGASLAPCQAELGDSMGTGVHKQLQ